MKRLITLIALTFSQVSFGNVKLQNREECGVVKGLKAWYIDDPGQLIFEDRTIDIVKGIGSGGFFESVLAASMAGQFRICVTLRPKTHGGEYIYKVERD
jgi:hypothetical protein